MARYFVEVAYKGTRYAGFQIQDNAITIQSEVEKAFAILHRQQVSFTGSSRTDAGVHALQNFFHFDYEGDIEPRLVYKMNAILPSDLIVQQFYKLSANSHCRFDATSRRYYYRLHQAKSPFLNGLSLYYPYKLNLELLAQGANLIGEQTDFFSFSKTNSQVNNYKCSIFKNEWVQANDELFYYIEANRFLRGMVRLITGTLLKLGREKITLSDVAEMIQRQKKCGYSVPPTGLFLLNVVYPPNYFSAMGGHLEHF